MTSKQLKFYQNLKKILTLNVFTETDKLLGGIKDAINLDYYSAVEVWEFLILDAENKLTSDVALAAVLCDKISGMFEQKALSRYAKTLVENPVICRAAYQYSPTCFASPSSVEHLASYIASGKEEYADMIMSCAFKNTSNKQTIGTFVKSVTENVFAILSKKAEDGKVRLNKKTAALLQGYVNKLKTSEKALLTQRIKEVS